jgi:hypothetical protein
MFETDRSLSDSVPPVPTNPATSTSGNRTPISFLDLPAEIRNRIHNYALVVHNPVELDRGRYLIKEPALLKTGQQVRNEALAIFYGANTFAVRRVGQSGIETAQSFLMWLGTKRAALLRSLRALSASDENNVWHAACVKIMKRGERQLRQEALCELSLYKKELQVLVKDLLSIDEANGIRETAILLPMPTGTTKKCTTHWVAIYELKDFIQEGSGKDMVLKRFSADRVDNWATLGGFAIRRWQRHLDTAVHCGCDSQGGFWIVEESGRS